MSVTPDGATAVSVAADGCAMVWDVQSGSCRHTLKGHAGALHWAALGSDGCTLLTVAGDRMIKAWDIGTSHCSATLPSMLTAFCVLPVVHQLFRSELDCSHVQCSVAAPCYCGSAKELQLFPFLFCTLATSVCLIWPSLSALYINSMLVICSMFMVMQGSVVVRVDWILPVMTRMNCILSARVQPP